MSKTDAMPVGTERWTKSPNGRTRVYVKVNETQWRPRAHVVWEEWFGPVPEGAVIHHVDRNPSHDSISNLAAMHPHAHSRIHTGPKRGRWYLKVERRWMEGKIRWCELECGCKYARLNKREFAAERLTCRTCREKHRDDKNTHTYRFPEQKLSLLPSISPPLRATP